MSDISRLLEPLQDQSINVASSDTDGTTQLHEWDSLGENPIANTPERETKKFRGLRDS
jgi:hypothetical protein